MPLSGRSYRFTSSGTTGTGHIPGSLVLPPTRFITAGAGQTAHLASSLVRVGRADHRVPLLRSSSADSPGPSSNLKSITTPDADTCPSLRLRERHRPCRVEPFSKRPRDSPGFSQPVTRRGGAAVVPDQTGLTPESTLRLESGFLRLENLSEWRTGSRWTTSALTGSVFIP